MKRNNRTVSEPVDLEERAWTNKRSGETVQLPRGVHPGFDTNPGATWLDIEAAADQVMPELADDRRARERGLLQALRLRQMAYRRETLIISDARGTNLLLRDAEPELPDRVSIDTLLGQNPQFPSESVDLLHSHLTDAPLSFFVFLTGRHASLADGSSFFLRRRCGAAFLLRSPRRRGTSRPSLSCARRLKVKRRGRPPSTSTQKNASTNALQALASR